VRASSWSWKELRRAWVAGIALACFVAWINLSLQSWGANEFARVMDPREHFTFADWNTHQFWRYEVVRPLLWVTSLIVLPVWLFRATKAWIAANSERLRPAPRIFRHWALAAITWVASLWVIAVVIEALTRFSAPAWNLVVPITLGIALLWLRSFTHPRVASFDQRYRSR